MTTTLAMGELSSTNSSRLDLENILNIVGDDDTLLETLFKQFEESFHKTLIMLDRIQPESKEWFAALHLLKGLALNLGAKSLASFCTPLQAVAMKEHSPHPDEDAESRIKHITIEYEYVIETLHKVIKLHKY